MLYPLPTLSYNHQLHHPFVSNSRVSAVESRWSFCARTRSCQARNRQLPLSQPAQQGGSEMTSGAAGYVALQVPRKPPLFKQKSADPGLYPWRGGAWDHLWCGPGLCHVSFGAGVAKTIEPQPCYTAVCQPSNAFRQLWRHSGTTRKNRQNPTVHSPFCLEVT